MTPAEFVAKWSLIQQKEQAVAQSHFNDLCALAGHPDPLTADPAGEFFTFEEGTSKPDGRKGRADVFYRGKFIWEYKGPHKDLDAAYRQLLLYREALDNPPLLITSDTQRIVIHTNFTNYPTITHELALDDLHTPEGLEKLRWVFYDQERFKPQRTRQDITKATADTFLKVAEGMKQHRLLMGESYSQEQLAHFLVRLLFCLFAEDIGLLPRGLFADVARARGQSYDDMQPVLRSLFTAMRDGGTFGYHRIRHFNGTLFDDDFVPSIPTDLSTAMLRAADQDWAQVDPSIFGTLFERIIDESKRAQLGAHYTSQDDILLIVQPVLMAPLRRRWDEVRRAAGGLDAAEAAALLAGFAEEIAAVRVLDPACGSGNFLYVALRELLTLQKEVIAHAERAGLPPIPLTVSPAQLHGIEINPYAHELAQITAWIGYLQWLKENGFGLSEDPILRPLRNILHMDAILAYDAEGRPVEPEWPAAEVIIGNPPFLGSRIMRPTFGDTYCNDLQSVYEGRIGGLPDLVCYWFEKARFAIASEQAGRAGLIATNSIRGGANRRVLDSVKETGDIFMTWDDHPWILESAAVRVSIVGFDGGAETARTRNGISVQQINSDLTAIIDLSHAVRLDENSDISFQGIVLRGPFRLSASGAKAMIAASNPRSGYLNRDVIKLRYNGQDITQRPENIHVIDFGVDTDLETAANYEEPFRFVKENVYPMRQKANQESARRLWWLHWNPRPDMRSALKPLERYIATPTVSKFRLFKWLENTVHPDHQLIVFAREDDYFFGVLHSRLHEVWALRMGTWLGKGNDPRYTPTTTFETFPFPWPPGQEPAEDADSRVAAIANWARRLNAWREAWLNPPAPRADVVDVAYEKMLKARTLTNLYNGLVYFREHQGPGALWSDAEFAKVTRKSLTRTQAQELDDLHHGLDCAVLDAYGWPHDLEEEAILERLLALNLERAGGQLSKHGGREVGNTEA